MGADAGRLAQRGGRTRRAPRLRAVVDGPTPTTGGDGHAPGRPRVPPRGNHGAGVARHGHQECPQTPTMAESGVTLRGSRAVMHVAREGREKRSSRKRSDAASPPRRTQPSKSASAPASTADGGERRGSHYWEWLLGVVTGSGYWEWLLGVVTGSGCELHPPPGAASALAPAVELPAERQTGEERGGQRDAQVGRGGQTL